MKLAAGGARAGANTTAPELAAGSVWPRARGDSAALAAARLLALNVLGGATGQPPKTGATNMVANRVAVLSELEHGIQLRRAAGTWRTASSVLPRAGPTSKSGTPGLNTVVEHTFMWPRSMRVVL
jgi:hypothetical protein